ncbi:MAG TPA: hypothetical protein VFL93_15425 [Longimicrobiaceae bacterium]|nr:hypothetical protein [Longimicrobiaceae bacterium]
MKTLRLAVAALALAGIAACAQSPVGPTSPDLWQYDTGVTGSGNVVAPKHDGGVTGSGNVVQPPSDGGVTGSGN